MCGGGKQNWEGYESLTEEDWMNSLWQSKEECFEENRKRVFTEGKDYLKECKTNDYEEPQDCLIYAKRFGQKVVIYNGNVRERQKPCTYIYD